MFFLWLHSFHFSGISERKFKNEWSTGIKSQNFRQKLHTLNIIMNKNRENLTLHGIFIYIYIQRNKHSKKRKMCEGLKKSGKYTYVIAFVNVLLRGQNNNLAMQICSARIQKSSVCGLTWSIKSKHEAFIKNFATHLTLQ